MTTSKVDAYFAHDFANLPPQVDQVITALKSENRSLADYHQLGLAYYRRSDLASFSALLKEGYESIANRMIYDQPDEHIALINCLAAYYIHLGIHEKDKRKAAEHFDEATASFNEADRIDMAQELTFIGKCVLILSKNQQLSKAECDNVNYQLNFVLDRNPKSVPCLLAKACIAYELEDYKNALLIYQRVLFLWPAAPAHVRLALGLCFFRLHDSVSAAKCFRRTLALEPTNLDALVALAILDINSDEDNAHTSQALDKLKAAYNLDRSHPVVLNHLSNHFFFKKEYNKAEALALNGYHNASIDKVKAESCFHLAKIYHIQDNFDEAFRFYALAIKLDPEFYPALFCLGQIYIQKNDAPNAILSFEKVLEKKPDNYEALKILSSLYSEHPKEQKKALSILKKITELYPNDVEAWIEYASYIETLDHAEALKAYRVALDKLRASNSSIPPELHNNAAVLLIENKQFLEAEACLMSALSDCVAESNANVAYYAQLRMTIEFNLGRLFEEQLRFDRSEAYYRGILAKDKSHIDAYLRLGLQAMRQGHYSEASDLYKDAIGLQENHKEAWSLLACHQLATKAITPSRKTFERILSKIDKHDFFSLLSLGNIYIQIARHEAKGSKSWDQNLLRATEFFQKCLMLDSKNFYAVNGLAIICAMKGHYAGAREVFLQVRQEEASFTDAWINLAHTYLEEGHHAAALNLYEHCQKKFSKVDNQVNLVLYIAKALYLIGKSKKDPSFFLQSIEWLERAYLFSPMDHAIRFNIALCQQEYAVAILGKEMSLRSFEQVSRAIRELDVASLTFEILGDAVWTTATSSALPYDPKVAKQRAKYCLSYKSNAQQQYQKQMTEEKQKRGRLEHLRHQREIEETELERQKDLALRQRIEEEQKIKEQRQSILHKVKTVQTKLSQEAAGSTVSADRETVHSSESEPQKPKRKLKKRKRASASMSDEEEEEENDDHEDDDNDDKEKDMQDQDEEKQSENDTVQNTHDDEISDSSQGSLFSTGHSMSRQETENVDLEKASSHDESEQA